MYYHRIEEAIAMLQSINDNEEEPVIKMRDLLDVHEDLQANLDNHLYALPVLAEIVCVWQHTESYPEVEDLLSLYQLLAKAEVRLKRRLTKIERVQAACFMYDLQMTLTGKKPLDWDLRDTYSNEGVRYDSVLLPFLVSYIKNRLPKVQTYETLVACGGEIPELQQDIFLA